MNDRCCTQNEDKIRHWATEVDRIQWITLTFILIEIASLSKQCTKPDNRNIQDKWRCYFLEAVSAFADRKHRHQDCYAGLLRCIENEGCGQRLSFKLVVCSYILSACGIDRSLWARFWALVSLRARAQSRDIFFRSRTLSLQLENIQTTGAILPERKCILPERNVLHGFSNEDVALTGIL